VDATRDASSVDNMEDKVYGSVRCVRMGAMKRQEAAEAADRRRFGRTRKCDRPLIIIEKIAAYGKMYCYYEKLPSELFPSVSSASPRICGRSFTMIHETIAVGRAARAGPG
jgi:hypothetical protein